MSDDARAAIVKVMRAHPTLTAQGFQRTTAADFKRNRADLVSPFGIGCFERAHAWLRQMEPRRIPNREYGHSYYAKHAAEKWAGAYVSNGALIAAALHLRLPIAQCPSLINCWIGVPGRRKWPKRVTVNA